MTRRWVRFEMPIMVLVDVDDRTEDQHVVLVAAADEQQDITLAHDRDGHVLAYDEAMERLTQDDPITAAAITLADSREWPPIADWDHGPDPLRDPLLHEQADSDHGDNDLHEPLTDHPAGSRSPHT